MVRSRSGRLAPSLAVIAAAAAVAASLTGGAAQAQPQPTPVVGSDPAAIGAVTERLHKRLGARNVGTYLDRATGRVVATISDPAAAADVTAAGGVPRVVRRSRAQLDSAASQLSASARIPGTAWSIDPQTNQLSVSYDSTVAGERLTRLRAAVARLGDAARLEASPGTLTPFISGGDAIYSSRSRCSLGFNVLRNGQPHILTAGHCTNGSTTWYGPSRSTTLGTMVGSSFPGNDYGLIQVTNLSVPREAAVGGQPITAAGTPTVGQAVQRRGSTTGLRGGSVTGLNATVNYPQGSVSGLIRTNVCAEPGDSGGALYSGTIALGITSGGSGNCTSGGTTYFQPVTEALSVYGLVMLGSTSTGTTTTSQTTSSTSSSTRTTTTSRSTSSTTSTATTSTGTGGGAGCQATYTITNQWGGGFQGDVTVRNTGTTTTRGWTVRWTFANGQGIVQSWNATVSLSGSSVTAGNVSYNGAIAPGASTSFGFQGTWTSANAVPSLTCSVS